MSLSRSFCPGDHDPAALPSTRRNPAAADCAPSVRTIDQATNSMTPCIGIRIINQTSCTVAAVVTAVVMGIAAGMSVLAAVKHAVDKCPDNRAGDDRADVMSLVAIHPGALIERVAPAMVIASDIGKDTLAPLGDPDVLAGGIVAPGPVQDARGA